MTADANVLASGALQLYQDAAPARFIDEWQAGRFSLVLSAHLLAEVSSTLAKPYFVKRLEDDVPRPFNASSNTAPSSPL